MLAVLLIALVRQTAATADPCQTPTHEGDSQTAGCFGWCSPAFADEHCSWCKCSGCPYCSHAQPTVLAVPTTTAVTHPTSVTTAAVCSDGATKDCEPFCSAAFKASHCESCKCQACSFCKCESELPDDVDEAICQDWCSAEFRESHCAACKCKGCDFCKHGDSCTPANADDTLIELCDSFCSETYAHDHCSLCKCKNCGFCRKTVQAAHSLVTSAPAVRHNSKGAGSKAGVKADVKGGGAVSTSADPLQATGDACKSDAPIGVWDSEVALCEDFCDAKERASHCKLCKCQACDLCRCHSGMAGDSNEEACEPWCSMYSWTTHCQMCASPSLLARPRAMPTCFSAWPRALPSRYRHRFSTV